MLANGRLILHLQPLLLNLAVTPPKELSSLESTLCISLIHKTSQNRISGVSHQKTVRMNKDAIGSQDNDINYSNKLQSRASRDSNILLETFWLVYSLFITQKKIKFTQT